jgi:hypothetical protein
VDRGGQLIETFGHLDREALLDAGRAGAFAKEQIEENKLWLADELNGVVLISMKKMSVSGDRPCLC